MSGVAFRIQFNLEDLSLLDSMIGALDQLDAKYLEMFRKIPGTVDFDDKRQKLITGRGQVHDMLDDLRSL